MNTLNTNPSRWPSPDEFVTQPIKYEAYQSGWSNQVFDIRPRTGEIVVRSELRELAEGSNVRLTDDFLSFLATFPSIVARAISKESPPSFSVPELLEPLRGVISEAHFEEHPQVPLGGAIGPHVPR